MAAQVKLNVMCSTIGAIVESYGTFLEVKHPQLSRLFIGRLKTNAASARAEAVVFSMLRANFDSAGVNECPSDGGFDFLCVDGDVKIAFEVTTLEHFAMERQSGLAEAQMDTPQWVGSIAPALRTVTSGKATQLANHPGPRVLAIVSEHLAGAFTLGVAGAEELLLGGTSISVPIDKPVDEAKLKATLENSAFFRFENGRIQSCRKSISCVLLVGASDSGLDCVGLIHPDPAEPFSPHLLSKVPFLRVKDWPLIESRIEIEWVVGRPEPWRFGLQEVAFEDYELKNT